MTRAQRASLLFILFASNVSADTPAIHVYVESPRPGEARKYARASHGEAIPRAPSGERTARRPIRSRLAPEAFIYGAPPASAPEPAAAPAHTAVVNPPRPPERDAAFVPDLDTGPEPITSYVEMFSPATGRKRFAAYDRVNDDGSLGVADKEWHAAPRVEMPLTAPPAVGFTRFAGDIRINLSASEFVPIPSVAAGARLVDARAEPHAVLTFAVDSAENWSVRANRDGFARLLYRLDAPDSYFGPTIAPDVDWSEIPASIRPTLGPALFSDASVVLKAIQLSRDQPFEYVVRGLAAYFRNFAPGEVPRTELGSAYKRIALGRVGVCRHRAYAFVVTAHALGIPARVVTNEAHVFVEVFAPRVKWVGIDLGGGALAINEYGIAGRPLYAPPRSSSFDWPSAEGTAAGPAAPGASIAESPPTMHSALPAGPRPSDAAAPAPAPASATAPASAPATAPDRPFVGVPERVAFKWEDAPRTATPGAPIVVRGHIATDTGEPVARAFVILTAATSNSSTPPFTLGPFPSDGDGRVYAVAVIPFDAPASPVTFSARVSLP